MSHHYKNYQSYRQNILSPHLRHPICYISPQIKYTCESCILQFICVYLSYLYSSKTPLVAETSLKTVSCLSYYFCLLWDFFLNRNKREEIKHILIYYIVKMTISMFKEGFDCSSDIYSCSQILKVAIGIRAGVYISC